MAAFGWIFMKHFSIKVFLARSLPQRKNSNAIYHLGNSVTKTTYIDIHFILPFWPEGNNRVYRISVLDYSIFV